MMGEVTGKVRWILRAEGLTILITSTLIYAQSEYSWLIFAIFFLAPDISFVGYLFNKRIGTIFYNLAHSLAGPLICIVFYLAFAKEVFLIAGIIWCAHIGIDRALGYGLKYSKGFGYTHLGRIGKSKTHNKQLQSTVNAPAE